MPIDPNAFARGYQQTAGMVGGMVDSYREGQRRNALQMYATNPNDPASLNALAGADPQLAIQVRQQQQQADAAKQERDTKMIAALARDAKDPATFDAAVEQVVAMGYPDAAQFRGKFSPGLRSALMAAGGLKDEAAAAPTTLERNYEFYQRTAPELAPKYLENQASPLRFVPDGAGGVTVVDPAQFRGPTGPAASQGGGPAPGTVEDGYRFKGGDPARKENWESVEQGGPRQSASGGFRP